MKKSGRNLGKLTKACSEMLAISKKYGYLWDEEGIWKFSLTACPAKSIPIACGFIAQDENFSIYIERDSERFVFKGKNFCYNHEGYSAEEAALTIKDYFASYKYMDIKHLRENFDISLRNVLGRYIAKKELEKITF